MSFGLTRDAPLEASFSFWKSEPRRRGDHHGQRYPSSQGGGGSVEGTSSGLGFPLPKGTEQGTGRLLGLLATGVYDSSSLMGVLIPSPY